MVFAAASSLGKCPRVRTARRSFEVRASIAVAMWIGLCPSGGIIRHMNFKPIAGELGKLVDHVFRDRQLGTVDPVARV